MQVLEKGLSLDYGLAQFSGVSLTYDRRRPSGSRLISVMVGDAPLDEAGEYTLVTGSFTATGGEGYEMFEGLPHKRSDQLVSDVFIAEFHRRGRVDVPGTGRLVDLAPRPK